MSQLSLCRYPDEILPNLLSTALWMRCTSPRAPLEATGSPLPSHGLAIRHLATKKLENSQMGLPARVAYRH